MWKVNESEWKWMKRQLRHRKARTASSNFHKTLSTKVHQGPCGLVGVQTRELMNLTQRDFHMASQLKVAHFKSPLAWHVLKTSCKHQIAITCHILMHHFDISWHILSSSWRVGHSMPFDVIRLSYVSYVSYVRVLGLFRDLSRSFECRARSTPRGPNVTGDAKNGSSVTLDLQRCHKDPQGSTRSHKDPQGVTRSHKDPQGVTRSHKDPQGVTCHED